MAVKQNPEESESSSSSVNAGSPGTVKSLSFDSSTEQSRAQASSTTMDHSETDVAVKSSVNINDRNDAVAALSNIQVAKILEVIDCVELQKRTGGVKIDMMVVYQALIFELARVNITRDCDLKRFKEDIVKVGKFFANATETCAYRLFLKTVCQIITTTTATGEQPSCAVAVILQLFSNENVCETVNELLEHTISDQQIRRTVNLLSNWLRVCNFCENLNLWIIAILNGILDQGKHSLFISIALDTIESHFNSLILPVLRPKVSKIVFLMLSPENCTLDVFHKILPKFTVVVNFLKKQVQDFENCKKTLYRLIAVTNVLMNRFFGYTALYDPVEAVIREIKSTVDFRDCECEVEEPVWFNLPQSNPKVGLINLGNTCYVNCILQALALTKQFCREILLKSTPSPVFMVMQKQIALMLYSARGELNPAHILNEIRPSSFSPGIQQDSSEFLSYLLETLHQQELMYPQIIRTGNNNTQQRLNVIGIKNDSLMAEPGAEKATANQSSQLFTTTIDKTFTGKMSTTYTCLSCNTKNTTTDTFRDLQLSFPDMETDAAVNYSAQDLLDYYCTTEKLYGDNKYYCSICKKLSDGQRSIDFITAPKNLILTIKHFKYDQNYHLRTKLQNKIFPDENISLRMQTDETMGEVALVHYDLYTSVVHSGYSVDSGHYYTYGVDNSNDWYKFNDSIVTKSELKELNQLAPPNTPYILFYEMSGHSIEYAGDVESTKYVKLDVPVLDELPPFVREYVNNENYLYVQDLKRRHYRKRLSKNSYSKTEEDDEQKPKTEIHSINKDMLNKYFNDDDDDQPPTSCGGNSLNSNMNLFIC